MHLNTCVIMHTQVYLYLCALANACMPTHMPTCLHTFIYIKCKYVRLDMHTKEMYQVRKSWFVHDPVERPVFHWLSMSSGWWWARLFRLSIAWWMNFAVHVITWASLFCIKNVNFSMWSRVAKLGYLFWIRRRKSWRSSAKMWQHNRKWHSSSKTWHTLQFLCSTGVVGLVCRPLSTSKVWELVLNFVKAFRYLGFLTQSR